MAEERETAGPEEPDRGETLYREESIVAIRQRFNYLTELWLLKDIDDEKYGEELARMVFADTQSALWFISPANGNWYRITDEEQPLPGEPPPTLLRPSHELLQAAAGHGTGLAVRRAAGGAAAATAPAGAAGASSAASPAGAAEGAGQRKFCTQCGSALREGARFCRECGTAEKGPGGGA